ncbi:MAG: NAD-binding protein [Leptolyngbyaceae cyanobacterium MO_188.B28]|nr:NAD-binding protein [Leptolyngbyaceae cyanobacterium MO_188.B28]
MEQAQYVVIVGCGRLESILASQLSGQGHSVVVIDRKEGTFNHLGTEFSGFQIVGDAAELAILRQAKTDKVDCLLAVTGEDNLNLKAGLFSDEAICEQRISATLINHDAIEAKALGRFPRINLPECDRPLSGGGWGWVSRDTSDKPTRAPS